MPRKAVVPAAVADALTANKPAVAVARAVSIMAGEPPDALAGKDIDALTAEILALQIQGNRVILAIGQRLAAAKDKLPHGDWLPWLASVNIPDFLAQRYMRLAREFAANPTLLSDLGMSKALALLALPEAERETFAAEAHVIDGETKSVADMTVKQLNEAVKARKDAERLLELREKQLQTANARNEATERDLLDMHKKLAEAQTRLSMAEAQQEAAIADKEAAREKLFAATDELFRLKNKPIEVAVEKVADPEAIEQARKEVREKMQMEVDFAKSDAETARQSLQAAKSEANAALQSLQAAKSEAEKAEKARKAAEAALDEANRAAKSANADAEAARKELERVKADAKAAPLSDNGLSLFNVLFEQTQAFVNQMQGVILKTEDPERKAKLQKALLALSDNIRKKAEA